MQAGEGDICASAQYGATGPSVSASWRWDENVPSHYSVIVWVHIAKCWFCLTASSQNVVQRDAAASVWKCLSRLNVWAKLWSVTTEHAEALTNHCKCPLCFLKSFLKGCPNLNKRILLLPSIIRLMVMILVVHVWFRDFCLFLQNAGGGWTVFVLWIIHSALCQHFQEDSQRGKRKTAEV